MLKPNIKQKASIKVDKIGYRYLFFSKFKRCIICILSQYMLWAFY